MRQGGYPGICIALEIAAVGHPLGLLRYYCPEPIILQETSSGAKGHGWSAFASAEAAIHGSMHVCVIVSSYFAVLRSMCSVSRSTRFVLAQLMCRTDGFALRAARSVSVILLLSLYGKLSSVKLSDKTFSKPGDVVEQA
jgi:hypothetical protein